MPATEACSALSVAVAVAPPPTWRSRGKQCSASGGWYRPLTLAYLVRPAENASLRLHMLLNGTPCLRSRTWSGRPWARPRRPRWRLSTHFPTEAFVHGSDACCDPKQSLGHYLKQRIVRTTGCTSPHSRRARPQGILVFTGTPGALEALGSQ